MTTVALKVDTKTLPKSRIAVHIEIPAERCKASYDAALSQLSRSIKLPGFRKGKVPKAVLIQQLGVSRIKAAALENLVESIWREVIEQESIQPLCEPELIGGFAKLLEAFNLNESLTLKLETDINPVPKLKETKGLKAKAKKLEFNPNKI